MPREGFLIGYALVSLSAIFSERWRPLGTFLIFAGAVSLQLYRRQAKKATEEAAAADRVERLPWPQLIGKTLFLAGVAALAVGFISSLPRVMIAGAVLIGGVLLGTVVVDLVGLVGRG